MIEFLGLLAAILAIIALGFAELAALYFLLNKGQKVS